MPLRALAAFFLVICIVAASYAHDHDHPELDGWFKSLSSSGGGVCCDGSDAFSILDPDWEIAGDHYRVRLDGKWIDVPEDRIVKSNNRVGIAKVWPIEINGKTIIRCFLPGSGA